MTDIMCSLPMQVGIKIKIDETTGEVEGWEVMEHCVEEINSFLQQISPQLKAATMAVQAGNTVEEGRGIFMIDEHGDVKSLDEVRDAIMDDMMADPDTPETKH
jgi:hypothetical protein